MGYLYAILFIGKDKNMNRDNSLFPSNKLIKRLEKNILYFGDNLEILRDKIPFYWSVESNG